MNKTVASSGPLYKLWHFFTSVKLTVVVLLCLAATSIIGTIIPQNEAQSAYFHQYGSFIYSLFSMLDIFDMYHSWWFRLLMVALALNIIACSVHRLSTTWNIIFNTHPSYNTARFKKLSGNIEFTDNRSPDELIKIYGSIIAKRFGTQKIDKSGNGYFLFAEKFRWTRIGAYIVHLSIMLLLTGSLIGSLLGFEGYVNIPEGEAVNKIRLRNSRQIYPLDFEIRCDDFKISFYDSGTPKEYRSSLTIIENQKPVLKRDIIVNDPLRYRGINIYQSGYGKMPAEKKPVVDIKSKKIVLNITNHRTGMTYTKELLIGEAIALPEGRGRFLIKEFLPSAIFGGQNIGSALIGILTGKGSDPKKVLLPLRFPDFDKMRNGHFVFYPANTDSLLMTSESDMANRYYTGLQVTKDPGVWVVYTGFVMMMIGCFVSFFMSHQQILIEIHQTGGETRVLVAGTANKNKTGMNLRLQKLSRILARQSYKQH